MICKKDIMRKQIIRMFHVIVIVLLCSSVSYSDNEILNHFSNIPVIGFHGDEKFQNAQNYARSNPDAVKYAVSDMEKDLNILIKKTLKIHSDPKQFDTGFDAAVFRKTIRFLIMYGHILGSEGKHVKGLKLLRCAFKLNLVMARGHLGICSEIITLAIATKYFSETFHGLMGYVINYNPPAKQLGKTLVHLNICIKKYPDFLHFLKQEREKARNAIKWVQMYHSDSKSLKGWEKYYTDSYATDVQKIILDHTEPFFESWRKMRSGEAKEKSEREKLFKIRVDFDKWIMARPSKWDTIWNPKPSLAKIVAAVIIPNMNRASYQDHLLRCRLKGALIVLGAMIYKALNKKWPKNVADLPRPKKMKYPNDPLSKDEKQPYIIKIKDNKLIVYSRGFDERDDGGEFQEIYYDKGDLPIINYISLKKLFKR